MCECICDHGRRHDNICRICLINCNCIYIVFADPHSHTVHCMNDIFISVFNIDPFVSFWTCRAVCRQWGEKNRTFINHRKCCNFSVFMFIFYVSICPALSLPPPLSLPQSLAGRETHVRTHALSTRFDIGAFRRHKNPNNFFWSVPLFSQPRLNKICELCRWILMRMWDNARDIRNEKKLHWHIGFSHQLWCRCKRDDKGEGERGRGEIYVSMLCNRIWSYFDCIG